jgi:hypothetical protein
MFLLTKKVIYIFIFLLFTLIFNYNCKRNKQEISKISDYREFNIEAAKKSCAKVRECFGYIYRTFPESILKKSTIEECENSALLNIDKKIETHTSNIQLLARTCYVPILNSNCKDLPLVIITDPNCNLLRAEIGKLNIEKYLK